MSGEPGLLGTLPPRFELRVAFGDAARVALAQYHGACCNGAPETEEGCKAAKASDWHPPQQKLAREGRNWHDGPLCNMVVMAVDSEGPSGIIAIAYHYDTCVVQAIHVALRARGPVRLSEHLWLRAKQELSVMPIPQQPADHEKGAHVASRAARAAVREQRERGSSSNPCLRVHLELACCQSKKGAAFWMGRCGWDGSVDSKKALQRWQKGDKFYDTQPGHYAMWYDISQ